MARSRKDGDIQEWSWTHYLHSGTLFVSDHIIRSDSKCAMPEILSLIWTFHSTIVTESVGLEWTLGCLSVCPQQGQMGHWRSLWLNVCQWTSRNPILVARCACWQSVEHKSTKTDMKGSEWIQAPYNFMKDILCVSGIHGLIFSFWICRFSEGFSWYTLSSIRSPLNAVFHSKSWQVLLRENAKIFIPHKYKRQRMSRKGNILSIL